MLRRASEILITAFSIWLCSSPAHADIGFELYSWPQGSRWNYAVYEGTSTPHSLESMRSDKFRLKNIDHLKGRIAALPAGEKLYWRVDNSRGLRLPPKEIIREIDRFATTAQVMLLLPGKKSDDKVLEEMQDEVQTILK